MAESKIFLDMMKKIRNLVKACELSKAVLSEHVQHDNGEESAEREALDACNEALK